MAEGARLESVFTRKGNVGSNPTLSASLSKYRHCLPDLDSPESLGIGAPKNNPPGG